MSVETRRSEIIEMLGIERYLKVADLSQRLGVSQMSIRRDIHHLEGRGLLRRMHGGLIGTRLLRLGLEISSNVAFQIRDGWALKNDIALAAATLVQSGDHLIFDSGILSYLTACSLPGDLLIEGELTVITNSPLIVLELAPWPGIETILLGGEYQINRMMNLTGRSTLRTLEGLHADKMFLTVDSIDSQNGDGITEDEAELESKMIAACTTVIMLSASCRAGQENKIKSLPVSKTYKLVISQGAPAEFVSYLRGQGAEVILA
jgi:DeoR family transcriptional regulator, aga operon transcriptional repressor